MSVPDPGDGDLHQPAGDAGPRRPHRPPAQPRDHRQHHEAVPDGGAGALGVQVGAAAAAARRRGHAAPLCRQEGAYFRLLGTAKVDDLLSSLVLSLSLSFMVVQQHLPIENWEQFEKLCMDLRLFCRTFPAKYKCHR